MAATTSKIKVSGVVTFAFDNMDAVRRLHDIINTGLNAMPSLQMFSEDVEELRDELAELLQQYGE